MYWVLAGEHMWCNKAPSSFLLRDFRRFYNGELRYVVRPGVFKDIAARAETAGVAGINLEELLKNLNEKIELLLYRDHRIGHSYFMNVETASGLHFAWYRRVLPLLQEYFYNDSERLYALLGDGLMKRVEVVALSSELSELVDTDSPRYEIKMLSESELLSALAEY